MFLNRWTCENVYSYSVWFTWILYFSHVLDTFKKKKKIFFYTITILGRTKYICDMVCIKFVSKYRPGRLSEDAGRRESGGSSNDRVGIWCRGLANYYPACLPRPAHIIRTVATLFHVSSLIRYGFFLLSPSIRLWLAFRTNFPFQSLIVPNPIHATC